MRPAPAVAASGSGGVGWRAVQALLPALAAAALVAWACLHLEGPAWPAGPAGVAAGLLAWLRAVPHAQTLRWDGQAWSIDGHTGRLAVMVDLGPAMLLRLQPAPRGPAHWLAITRSEAGGAWHPLRAALYSRPSPTTLSRVLPPERADP